MISQLLIRQKIVTTIVETMETISSNNGFYSEAGKNVFEWLQKPLEDDDYPAIIVRDTTDNANNNNDSCQHTLKIEIDIAVKDMKLATWNIREVASDVIKAFGIVEDSLNYECAFTGSDFAVEHKDTIYGGARLDFEVVYNTRRWEQ